MDLAQSLGEKLSQPTKLVGDMTNKKIPNAYSSPQHAKALANIFRNEKEGTDQRDLPLQN
jgi:hypothetical protein